MPVVEKSKGGGAGWWDASVFRWGQLRILKQTTVICLKGSLSNVFQL